MRVWILAVLISLCTHSSISSRPTHILITVQDIIFYISYRSIAYQIGWINMAWYTMQRHDPRYIHDFLMHFLHGIEPKTNIAHVPIGNYFGEKVPPIISEWFLGREPSRNFLSYVTNHIEQHELDSSQKSILLSLANVTFNPSLSPSILEALDEGCQIIKQLHDTRRFTLIGMINSNDELFELIRSKFNCSFNLFDDIVTSQEAQSIMPHKEFFRYVLHKHGIAPTDCLYIGNYEPSIKTAQELGIPTLACDNYDFKTLTNVLQSSELLS